MSAHGMYTKRSLDEFIYVKLYTFINNHCEILKSNRKNIFC